MTQKQQRIEIAKACPDLFDAIHGKVYLKNGGGLTDPLNDLNVMREAEKTIPAHLRLRYANHIAIVVGNAFLGDYDEMHSITATAPQRAEAFLCTISKWEES